MPKLYYKDPSTGAYVEYTPVASIPQEWKDKVDGKVDDVQVNGTSIVQDGIAYIPLVDEQGTAGLVRIVSSSETGLVVGAINGIGSYVKVNYANESRIASRTGRFPITPINLNPAVKATLTDGNKMVLTDEEKAAACQTVGADEKFKLIMITDPLEEDISNYSIFFPEPLIGWSQIRYLIVNENGINTPIVSGTGSGVYYFTLLGNASGGGIAGLQPNYLQTTPGNTDSSSIIGDIRYYREAGILWTSNHSKYSGYGSSSNIDNYSKVSESFATQPLYGLRFYGNANNDRLYKTGTKIIVYAK